MLVQREMISDWFKKLQEDVCLTFNGIDKKAVFNEDPWERTEGGGGQSNVMAEGEVFEKGGVMFSKVFGELPEAIKKTIPSGHTQFFATGISIIMHPQNPFVPIIHMNLRYFEMEDGTYWFGGGMDLTPHYFIEHDARFFHKNLKNICNGHDGSYYTRFKAWADDYFFIPHRNETRGIGGIFFDRLNDSGDTGKARLFSFVKGVGDGFIPIYSHLVLANKDRPYTVENQKWQHLRRGRYVEFNLMYDAGTRFGLETNGRTESILVSLPPISGWMYRNKPEAGSMEEKTLLNLKKGINFA